MPGPERTGCSADIPGRTGGLSETRPSIPPARLGRFSTQLPSAADMCSQPGSRQPSYMVYRRTNSRTSPRDDQLKVESVLDNAGRTS